MNEPKKAGRPRKNVDEDFRAISELSVSDHQDLSESIRDSHVGMEVDVSKDNVVNSVVVAEYHFMESSNSNGWRPLGGDIIIHQPPRNGMPVYLSSDPEGDGQLFYWKRTRAFNGKRYEETGKWVNFQTGADIPFVATLWKERF